MTRIVKTISEWKEIRALSTFDGKRIGFVPTMGALHDGHESLLKRARQECDFVVASIFVNPTQFNDPKDLTNYPRTWDSDLERLEKLHVDFLLAPEYSEIYPDNYNYILNEKTFSKLLCGAKRPGHFDGVLTVVLKLFNLVRPQRAYFGEKDFQQQVLIKEMISALFLDIELVACPTIREPDGLALSSRNARLTAHGRTQAALFPKLLMAAATPEVVRKNLEANGFKVDYVEDRDGRRYGAVFVEEVRLIDNGKI